MLFYLRILCRTLRCNPLWTYRCPHPQLTLSLECGFWGCWIQEYGGYRCQPACERRPSRKDRALSRGSSPLFVRGQGGPAGSSLMQRKAALSRAFRSGYGS